RNQRDRNVAANRPAGGIEGAAAHILAHLAWIGGLRYIFNGKSAPAVDMRTPGGKKARPAHGTLRRIFPPPNRRKPVGTAPNRPAHAGILIFEQIRNKIGFPLGFNGLWLLPNRNKRGTKNIGRLAALASIDEQRVLYHGSEYVAAGRGQLGG